MKYIFCMFFVCIHFVFTTHYYSLSFDVPRFIVQPPCATSDSWPGSNQPRATSWQSHQMDNLTADANILGCLQSVGGRCWTETASSISDSQDVKDKRVLATIEIPGVVKRRQLAQESQTGHQVVWRLQWSPRCRLRRAVGDAGAFWCDVTHVFKSMERSHSESRTSVWSREKRGWQGVATAKAVLETGWLSINIAKSLMEIVYSSIFYNVIIHSFRPFSRPSHEFLLLFLQTFWIPLPFGKSNPVIATKRVSCSLWLAYWRRSNVFICVYIIYIIYILYIHTGMLILISIDLDAMCLLLSFMTWYPLRADMKHQWVE